MAGWLRVAHRTAAVARGALSATRETIFSSLVAPFCFFLRSARQSLFCFVAIDVMKQTQGGHTRLACAVFLFFLPSSRALALGMREIFIHQHLSLLGMLLAKQAGHRAHTNSQWEESGESQLFPGVLVAGHPVQSPGGPSRQSFLWRVQTDLACLSRSFLSHPTWFPFRVSF